MFIGLIAACVGKAAAPATVVATKREVTEFCGTGDVRLVFVHGPYGTQRRVYSIDYTAVAQGVPPIVEMDGTAGAILPSISSDGAWVTFAVGPRSDGDGSVPSSAYLVPFGSTGTPVLIRQDSAYEPRFVPNVDTMTLIYATANGADVYAGPGRTVTMACPDGRPSGIQRTVYADGSWVGGLNWDHTFLCTGYQQARMVGVGDNSRGPSRRLHRITFRRDDAGDSTVALQVCNPSPSPSRVGPPAMLYLDFGYPFLEPGWLACGIDVGPGGFYAQHELFFIAGYDGRIVQDYRAPDNSAVNDPDGLSGRLVWDDPEWSNHPYFAVAALQANRKYSAGATRNREALVLVNLRDSTYLKVVGEMSTESDSANLQWPWVWVEVPGDFQEQHGWLPVRGRHSRRPSDAGASGESASDALLLWRGAAAAGSLYGLSGRRLSSKQEPVTGVYFAGEGLARRAMARIDEVYR